jgi:hypothetical protein
MLIPFNVKNGLSLMIPDEICCNCGANHGISMKETPLFVVKYMVLAGTQLTIPFEFPYCNSCVKTAKRTPVNLMKIILLIAFFSAIMFSIVVFGKGPELPNFVIDNMIYFTTIISGIVVSSYYYLKKPLEFQSSYYQPIRLKKVNQKFASGKIVGITLKFTNEKYSEIFRSANEKSILDKVLTVAK